MLIMERTWKYYFSQQEFNMISQPKIENAWESDEIYDWDDPETKYRKKLKKMKDDSNELYEMFTDAYPFAAEPESDYSNNHAHFVVTVKGDIQFTRKTAIDDTFTPYEDEVLVYQTTELCPLTYCKNLSTGAITIGAFTVDPLTLKNKKQQYLIGKEEEQNKFLSDMGLDSK